MSQWVNPSFYVQIAHSLFCSQKTSNSLKNWLKSNFLVRFFVSFFLRTSDSLIPSSLMSNVSELLRSLTKNEQKSESLIFCKKRAICSESRWPNSQPCSRCYLKKSNVSDSHVIRVNRSQKTNDWLKRICIFRMFLTVFHCFSSFYAQEQIAPIALRSIALF